MIVRGGRCDRPGQVAFGVALAGGPEITHREPGSDFGLVRVHPQIDAVHGSAEHLGSPSQVRQDVVVTNNSTPRYLAWTISSASCPPRLYRTIHTVVIALLAPGPLRHGA